MTKRKKTKEQTKINSSTNINKADNHLFWSVSDYPMVVGILQVLQCFFSPYNSDRNYLGAIVVEVVLMSIACIHVVISL
jgi:hypothetical protein